MAACWALRFLGCFVFFVVVVVALEDGVRYGIQRS